jgi:Protein of unknown function (DUF1475)
MRTIAALVESARARAANMYEQRPTMQSKVTLKTLFSCILLTMLACTVWASTRQSVWEWGGLKGIDGPWTRATLTDAYCGFLTFYAWVWYKESGRSRRIGWFIAIMLLGNMAMSAYVLLQLRRLPAGQPTSSILLRFKSAAPGR